MIAKFSEAFHLLRQNLGLFTAIILTVWLPGHILINGLAYNLEGASELIDFKLTLWIEGIFAPIYIGALVHALFRIKSGQTVTYREAIAVGYKNWGTLFGARFVAGAYTLLGLIAFIIPGVILAVRYALLDSAVIVEGRGMSASRTRSIDLTAGMRWQIFLAAVLYFIGFMGLSFLIYLPLGFAESLDIMPVGVVIDCILEVAFSIIQIVMFLFYWEATQHRRVIEASDIPDSETDAPADNPALDAGPEMVS